MGGPFASSSPTDSSVKTRLVILREDAILAFDPTRGKINALLMHAGLNHLKTIFSFASNLLVAAFVLMGSKSLGGPPPIIIIQPTNQTVIVGAMAVFHVEASSPTPMTYQWWYFNTNMPNMTNMIPGADEATLKITNVQPSDARTYYVVIRNLSGTIRSSNASLMVLVPPHITQQPQSTNAALCSTVSFNVTVNSTLPLRYQWRFGTNAIAEATNATLLVSNVHWSHGGDYHVVVSNSAGSVASSNATLTVYSSGGQIGSFAWRVPLGAMGSQIVSTPSSNTPPTTGTKCGPLTENARWIQLLPEEDGMFIIDTIGSDFDTVLAVYRGENLQELMYIGCDNNGAPDGVRSQVKAPAWRCENYFVAVDGVKGAQGTIQLNWKLGRAPVIIRQPESQTVVRGSNVSFHVEAAGVPAPAFQWRFNGADIAGATDATWTLTNAQPTNAGIYSVVAHNFFGEVLSDEAALDVQSVVRLTALGIAPDGFHFRLNGPPGTYTIEASATLTNWFSITNVNAPDGMAEVIDPEASFLQQRFYRAASP